MICCFGAQELLVVVHWDWDSSQKSFGVREFWGVVVHWDACHAYMKRRETISIFTNSCPVEIHLIEDFASFK